MGRGGGMSLVVNTGQCMARWKVRMRNEKDWVEDISSKNILKWYKLAKNGAGVVGLCRIRKL